eukprot:COSAG01_NODE_1748_length_9329_cov_99.035861_12_plen_105_part_00
MSVALPSQLPLPHIGCNVHEEDEGPNMLLLVVVVVGLEEPPQLSGSTEQSVGITDRASNEVPSPTDLSERFHSQFRDENRRDIGESQSKWTDSKMETLGSPRST